MLLSSFFWAKIDLAVIPSPNILSHHWAGGVERFRKLNRDGRKRRLCRCLRWNSRGHLIPPTRRRLRIAPLWVWRRRSHPTLRINDLIFFLGMTLCTFHSYLVEKKTFLPDMAEKKEAPLQKVSQFLDQVR